MATSTLFTIPTQSYPTGAQPVPPVAVPASATQILVTLDVSQMTNPAQHYEASFDLSFDGGVNWQFLIATTRDGGVLRDRNGQPVPTATFGVGLDQVGNANRRIRGTVTIVGPITMGGTVQVF